MSDSAGAEEATVKMHSYKKKMQMRADSSGYSRWIIVASLFGLCFASYVERMNLPVAAVLMMPALSLSKQDIALALNGFLVGYGLFQLPAGWLGDKVGVRLVLGLSAVAWGLLTLATGYLPGLFLRSATGTLTLLCAVRFLLGAAEASTFPVGARAVHQWIPPSKRGTGNSLMLSGSSAASALTAPCVAFLMSRYGWRVAFYVTALASFVVGLIWFRVTRNALAASPPKDSETVDTLSLPHTNWLTLNVVLLSLSYASEGYLLFTFVSWLYIYLVEVRGFSLINGGFMSSLPWLAAIVATPLGGIVSDRLRGHFGRFRSSQIVITAGYSLSGLLLLVAAEVHGRILAVLALSISLSAMYLAESSFWTVATTLAGERHAAVVAAFMNTVGIAGGIASTSAVPLLIKHYGAAGWTLAFAAGTGMGLMTASLWILLGRRLQSHPLK